MSASQPTPSVCPKCGYHSSDDRVCEACGALLTKIRGRDFMGAVEQEDDDYGSPAPAALPEPPAPEGRSWLTIGALVVLVGVIGGVIYLVNRGPGLRGSVVAEPPSAQPEPQAAPPAPATSGLAGSTVPGTQPKSSTPTKPAAALSWLNALKEATTSTQVATPAATPAPAIPSAAAPPATAATAATAKPSPTRSAGQANQIEIGEDTFSRPSQAPASKADRILRELEARKGAPPPAR